jgi:methyltransferase (TIGR00027 family)
MNSNLEITHARLAPDLSDVAATSLLTLYARAMESQSQDPILSDDKAVEIVQHLNPLLAESPDRLLRSLANGKISRQLCVHLALRAKQYDTYTHDFLALHPQASIISIGCGMDTRFYRIDNGQVHFFDLDLPEVIRFKREFVDEEPRYHLIAASVFDYAWMDRVEEQGALPVLFLAEGVFMYLEPERVRALFGDLARRFPGSELVCEVVNSRWLSKWLQPLLRSKMQSQLGMGAEATFRFGITDGYEPESWHPGIRLLDQWSYFDSHHPKLGMLGVLGRSELFRRTQWSVRYRLGDG